MQVKYLTIILLAIIPLIILCGCISAFGQNKEIDSLVKKLAVPEKIFLAITNGSSLDVVKDAMGIAARHEFTVSERKIKYDLIDCWVCPSSNMDDVSDFWLLFRDNTLVKIMSPVSFPELRETYKY